MTDQLGSILHSDDDLFYFESDHLALKGNKDYCEVLKTVVILTAQREAALKDLSKVVLIRKESLANPVEFLEKIKNGENLRLPPLNELPKIPNIDFEKYDSKISEEDLKLIYSDIILNEKSDVLTQINKNKSSNNSKKQWTLEEQKRLEELLVLYPPEPIENRRFQKIAKALGNRTAQQVCSRVQKYFLKLYKAGLPIPGRIPKSSEKYKKCLLHKHQRHNHYLWKPTTFFPDLCVPVTMNEFDNIPGPSSSSVCASAGSSNYLLPMTVYHQSSDEVSKSFKNESELQLELLNRIKLEKLREKQDNYYPFQHVGFRCDYCDEEPIVGSRWHCTTCTDSIDFCTDCVLSQMYSENCHPLLHKLVTYYDDGNVNDWSDSESYSGSVISNTNKNYDSDSSECDNFDQSQRLSEVMTEQNGLLDNEKMQQEHGLSAADYLRFSSELEKNNFDSDCDMDSNINFKEFD